MKSKKKAITAVITMAVLLAGMAVSSSAASYAIGPFSAGTTVSETANYNFDNNPSNQIRFISNPRCSVAGAKVQYALHTFFNTTRPESQTAGMGSQIRTWWSAAAGKHHVEFYIYNNVINPSTLAPVEMTGTTWFENFTGSLW